MEWIRMEWNGFEYNGMEFYHESFKGTFILARLNKAQRAIIVNSDVCVPILITLAV